ncbi:hypothetical protein [Alkalihalobacillus sp. R86527]|uniref:hypothetical protein n=1 Tax=Alkalihalobacillus sp. R86527 TaxID=3093863 RepID=UPI00366B5ED9
MNNPINTREVHPASGAIIMALGIFLYADIEAFPFIDQYVGWIVLIGVWLLSFSLFSSLGVQFSRKDYRKEILRHPVRFFAMGTWIAGVFVLCQVTIKYFPALFYGVQVLALFNSILCFLFLGGCLLQFTTLLRKQGAFSTHGVILLSTVTIQALVITWAKIFFIPVEILIFGILFGCFFYLCGAWLISIRYMKRTNWLLKDDWANTNCILHGALSITGLALVYTQAISPTSLFLFWIIVLLVMLSVETIEIVRALERIRAYGWKRGLFTYDVSQWSRNFTFGMFYAFSTALPHPQSSLPFIVKFHTVLLPVWSWIVLLLLCVELCLWGAVLFSERKREDKKDRSSF